MTTSDEFTVTTNPAAARVQKISVPVASPGNCILCGKSEHPDGFADARLDFEFYGTLYLCADCVGDFARLFGWLHPGQARALAMKYQEVSNELETHREALLHLEQSVEELTNYRMLRNTLVDPSDGSNVDDATNQGDEEVSDASSASVIEFPASNSGTESNVSESVTEQGPDDVPSPRSDESEVPILEL